jgi:hypothetical protein
MNLYIAKTTKLACNKLIQAMKEIEVSHARSKFYNESHNFLFTVYIPSCTLFLQWFNKRRLRVYGSEYEEV